MSSLPKFFLGKYFQFWKPPPLFCIKSRDNVYYPVFLGCYIIRKTGIKYTVICIVSVCRSVKMLSQYRRFSLGKARESVFSLPNHPQPHPQNYPQPLNHPQVIDNLVDNYTNTTTPTNTVILSHHYTIHTNSLEAFKHYI